MGNRSGENGVKITNFSSLICKLSVSTICFCSVWRQLVLFRMIFGLGKNYKFNIQMDPCIIVSSIGCLSKDFKMSASPLLMSISVWVFKYIYAIYVCVCVFVNAYGYLHSYQYSITTSDLARNCNGELHIYNTWIKALIQLVTQVCGCDTKINSFFLKAKEKKQ